MSNRLLAKVSDIPAQGAGALQLQVGNTPIGIFRVGDEIVAWRDVCPHQAASVCSGEVDGTRLTSDVYEYKYGRHEEVLQCPWHGWEFDLITGKHLAEGSLARLRRHPIRIQNGCVYDASRSSSVDLDLVILETKMLAEHVIQIDLGMRDGSTLPSWTPGTHLQLVLPSGRIRHYSLCGDIKDRKTFRVAVLREEHGDGGSQELFESATAGMPLQATAIRNRFPLVFAEQYLLIAGGIGITPLIPMISQLRRQGKRFSVVYTGRSRETMAFIDDLEAIPEVQIVESSRDGRIDVHRLIHSLQPGTAVFACGPTALLEDVRLSAIHTDTINVHTEEFAPETVHVTSSPDDRPITVELARSHKTVDVAADQTILAAVRNAGVTAPSSCESGWCGSCETGVIDGYPDHRDTVLTDEERECNETMMICVGRSKSESLILDL